MRQGREAAERRRLGWVGEESEGRIVALELRE